MRHGFIKVAAGTPRVRVADTRYNASQIIALMEEAAGQGVKVLALPELCLTGYTCGDLFLQDTLLRGAVGDETTPADNCVTIRERDSMEQVRVPISQLKEYLAERLAY